MKRAGYLIERIADMDNLSLAYCKARRGKQAKPDVQEFSAGLQANLLRLRHQLLAGTVAVGNYHFFKIYDPKERVISAAPFAERVMHHAIMNVCHAIFEKTLIADTYATRPGKGIYQAIAKARKAMKTYRYVAKLDFRKYFDSISHETLKHQLRSKFKDPALLAVFGQIIDSYSTSAGRGLPIGNLTSQYFANFYLSAFDHHIKETLRVPVYVRYMDDMLLFAESKEILKEYLQHIEAQSEKLQLTLKAAVINQTEQGISFLGYKLFPSKVLLNRRSKIRFRRKMAEYNHYMETAQWSEKTYQMHLLPLLSFARYAYTKQLRKEIIEGSNRVLRGGSWNNNARNCRVSNRNNNTPTNRNNNNGFRLAHSSIQTVSDDHRV
ncbi:MAG: RNA-directed DNA polymerase [Bacteroidales bacterium]|jgi:retron-type reverse transcriptase|nr:RNA-directed DNA polymerase [Bacteroidales bacterium]